MAGCGCGKGGAANRRIARMQNQGGTSVKGIYPLATFPECAAAYTGDMSGESVIVVGRLTAGEKLFARKDYAAASEYAQQVKSGIENLPSTGLCQTAVESVYS